MQSEETVRRRKQILACVLCVMLCVSSGACTATNGNGTGTTQTADAQQDQENASGSDSPEDAADDDEAEQLRAKALPADYDLRMEIWEHPAGYSTERKADHMNISDRDWLEVTANSSDLLIGEEFVDATLVEDSFYNGFILGNGLELETYEDIPYVIPYLVRDAFGAVIVLSGGGFYYKTMNGYTFEAKDVALSLNRAGYSAFVLNYRTNPYEYPVPQLDVQRAVRFVRANAEEYSYNGDNIGLIGFSAGAYQAAFFVNALMGNDMFPEGYKKDSLDAVDDTVQHAAFIYPMFNFRHNVPMLCCLFDIDTLLDENAREEILDETDMTTHFTSKAVPQFVAYGTKDGIVGAEGTRNYLTAARKAGASIAELTIQDGGHLFGQEYYMDAYLEWLRKR